MMPSVKISDKILWPSILYEVQNLLHDGWIGPHAAILHFPVAARHSTRSSISVGRQFYMSPKKQFRASLDSTDPKRTA